MKNVNDVYCQSPSRVFPFMEKEALYCLIMIRIVSVFPLDLKKYSNFRFSFLTLYALRNTYR